jgi:ABC-2 type transport system ATP-binding protein
MTSDSYPSIQLQSVYKRFGSFTAVHDVSFAVYPGEIFGLLGPNGAGKTTSIRMMLDIFQPDAGTAHILGGPMTEAKKRLIGYMPEDRGLYQDQRLERVLTYLASLKGMSKAEIQPRLTAWLQRLDLVEHRQKRVKELSKGMQQKGQIIATLLHDPAIIVVDEPFSGLDPVNTRLVKDILEEQRQAGKTIIMSTHQMYQVEALCQRIVLINKGRSVLYGPVQEVKQAFANNAVEVVGEGNFAELAGVLEVRQQNRTWHLLLDEQTTPQMIYAQLAQRADVLVERFEVARPSLDEIFMLVVQQGHQPQDGAQDA